MGLSFIKSYKKYTSVLAVLFICALLMIGTAAPAAADVNADVNAGELSIQSPAGYIIDYETGDVLYGKNAGSRRAIASTTKIMTCMLVIEKADLNEIVRVSANAASTGGSTIGLKEGETRSVEELLYAMMLGSANDAAVALAEHVSGTEEDFAFAMTDRAKRLGAVNTRFSVPHGLALGAENFSTAEDLAIIALEAMKKPLFKKIVSTDRFNWDLGESDGMAIIDNSNGLLDDYPPSIGIKTGYTAEAGYCLVAAARASGRTAIAIVLGGGSRDVSFNDSKKMLDWALKEFSTQEIVTRDRRCAVVTIEGRSVPLIAGSSVEDLVYIPRAKQTKLELKLKSKITLPVNRGDRIGSLNIITSGGDIRKVDVFAGRTVRSSYNTRNIGGYWRRVVNKILNLF